MAHSPRNGGAPGEHHLNPGASTVHLLDSLGRRLETSGVRKRPATRSDDVATVKPGSLKFGGWGQPTELPSQVRAACSDRTSSNTIKR